MCVTHQAVNEDRSEGHVVRELQTHHDHAGDPEEQDVKGGDHHSRRVKPEDSDDWFSQPSVVKGQRAELNQVSSTSSSCRSGRSAGKANLARASFSLLATYASPAGIPGRDAMSPPNLAADDQSRISPIHAK